MTYLKHMLALVLAGALIFFGAQKFGAENFIFERIALRSGIDLFEPYVRMLTGVGEVLAGLGLIVPRLRGLGAALATAIVGGAVAFHLSPWLGVHTPMEAGGEESTALFTTAVIVFVLAIVNLVINWSLVPIIGNRVR